MVRHGNRSVSGRSPAAVPQISQLAIDLWLLRPGPTRSDGPVSARPRGDGPTVPPPLSGPASLSLPAPSVFVPAHH